MSHEKKMRLYDVVEFAAPRLNIKESKLFLTLKSIMEKEEDVFTSDKPIVRIHQGNQEECESCSA